MNLMNPPNEPIGTSTRICKSACSLDNRFHSRSKTRSHESNYMLRSPVFVQSPVCFDLGFALVSCLLWSPVQSFASIARFQLRFPPTYKRRNSITATHCSPRSNIQITSSSFQPDDLISPDFMLCFTSLPALTWSYLLLPRYLLLLGLIFSYLVLPALAWSVYLIRHTSSIKTIDCNR